MIPWFRGAKVPHIGCTGPTCWRAVVIFRTNSLLSVSLRFCHLPAQRHRPSDADLSQLLSQAERERCARLPGLHASRAIVARALVRTELSAALGVASSTLTFAVGRHGKPEVFDPPQPIAFNLSHSGEWIVLAWHTSGDDAPLGVDVEHRQADGRDVMRLARRYFSHPEQLSLQALEGDARERLFYRLWTLKEAWVKAHGLALAPQLGAVSFALHKGTLGVANATAQATGRFLHGEPGANAWASVCVLAEDDRPLGVDASAGMPLGEWSRMSLREWSGSLSAG